MAGWSISAPVTPTQASHSPAPQCRTTWPFYTTYVAVPQPSNTPAHHPQLATRRMCASTEPSYPQHCNLVGYRLACAILTSDAAWHTARAAAVVQLLARIMQDCFAVRHNDSMNTSSYTTPSYTGEPAGAVNPGAARPEPATRGGGYVDIVLGTAQAAPTVYHDRPVPGQGCRLVRGCYAQE